MADIVTIKFTDDKAFDGILKKVRNASGAMQEIRTTVMSPLASRAWSASGLHSRSGELKHAVKTWSGKRSAGVSIHTSPGHDLIIPKAVTHTDGARRHQWRRKKRYIVREYRRAGVKVGEHERRNVGSPWGDIKARPFIPTRLSGADAAMVRAILRRHINV